MFRAFSSKKGYSLSPEKDNEEVFGFKAPPLMLHVNQLLVLLRQTLLAHQYTEARQLMTAVVHAMDLCPDIVRRAGVTVLRQSEDTYPQCVRFYKKLLTKHSQTQREVLLLELALFMVSHGNIQEAVDVLSSYLQSDPFKSNQLLQSYAGLFNYILWRSAMKETAPLSAQQKGEEEGRNPMEEEEEEEERSGLVEEEVLMEGHIVLAGTVDPQPSSTSSSMSAAHARSALRHWKTLGDKTEQKPIWHPFAREHAELLQHSGQGEEAVDLVLKVAQDNRENVQVQRMALNFLRCHHPSESELIVALLRGVVAADPSSSEGVELARVLWEESRMDAGATPPEVLHEMSQVLSVFLEYPHNQHKKEAQQLLDNLHRHKVLHLS